MSQDQAHGFELLLPDIKQIKNSEIASPAAPLNQAVPVPNLK